jgi:hypothetical protein
MPSLIDLNEAANVKPPEAQTEGEYKVRINSCTLQDSKKGNPMLVIGFEIEDEGDELTLPAFYYLNLPHGDMTVKQQKLRLLDVGTFCLAFGIELSTLEECTQTENFETIIGSTGWAHIQPDDYEGRPKKQNQAIHCQRLTFGQ